MVGLLAPALAALGVRLALGGRPNFAVRWWPLAFAALLAELALYSPPIDTQPWAIGIGPWIWLATRMALLMVVARNVSSRGIRSGPWLVAGVGLALNTLVIAANDGHMPQSAEAAASVWGAERASMMMSEGRLSNVSRLTDATRLAPLGDVVAQPAWWPRPNVVSPGDILLALGIAGVVWQSTSRRAIRDTALVL